MLRFILGFVLVFVTLPALADPVLNSAILPNERVVPKEDIATIFMTTTNSGDMDAANCQVVSSNTIGNPDISKFDVTWALTDASGTVVGNQNDPFSILAGGAAQLVLGIARGASAGNFDNESRPVFHVECDGGFGSPGWPAVNGARIQFRDNVPDIIPIVQTLSADGIANFDDGNRLAVVSVAAVNNSAIKNATGEEEVGIGGQYRGFSKAGNFDFFACETDATGMCLGEINTCSPSTFQSCFTAMIGAVPKTFSFFPILPPGQGAPFFPQVYRFAPSFHEVSGSTLATSSVALNSANPMHNGNTVFGQHDFVIRNTNDLGARTLRSGIMQFGANFVSGILFRTIDQGFFISVVFQQFEGTGTFGEADGGSDCSPTTLCNEPMTAAVDWVFYDTGAGSESDGTITTGTCTINPEKGGTCSFPDAPGEQVVGEPDFFDALEAGSLVAGNDFSGLVTKSHFFSKKMVSVANENFVFDTPIVMVPVPGELDAVTFKLDGCQFNNFEIIENLFSNKVTQASIVLGGCDSGSPLEPLSNDLVITNMFLERKESDGSCIYRIIVVLDRGNPNSKTYTFFIKTEAPAGEAPLQSAQTDSLHKRAQTLANTEGKPVYWWINGKNVLAAKPME